ncbi:Sporulation kinase E [Aquisphaera giovannonii]|uniref:histidine kinase n=1 Tax=Aquisphaera giovannonii TaxID=406548 RepID=A0A5B9WCT5_9BACT|nr:ATP-binding protein [Aquisphaera giovannonii]QEH37751.1 Sporulation kinase E [Aquisphaera giovannonii]
MRGHPGRNTATHDLRLRVDALEHLPVRAATARHVLAEVAPADEDGPTRPAAKPGRSPADLDPGWVLGEASGRAEPDPLRLVSERAWWPVAHASGARGEAFQLLWRHSIAVSLAARTIARERGEPDPVRYQRAGMLHGLALWAVAAADPDWLVRWLGEPDRRARGELERSHLGTDLPDLGRRLAERWGCEPDVVDAAWLHDPSSGPFADAASDPGRLAIIREAYLRAEGTPWSLSDASRREAMPQEPHLRILVAEVQSRCGSLFASADATPHEEALARRHARALLRLRAAERLCASQGRLLHAISTSGPVETPESWAARAGTIWCAEPEVSTARVSWEPATPRGSAGAARPEGSCPEPTSPARPPSARLSLGRGAGPTAEVELWCDPAQPGIDERLAGSVLVGAWESWASAVASRAEAERKLQAVVASARDHVADEALRLQAAKLDALAEFAAGAGHELNNPLAVIVGRAQLLLARSPDAESSRSLGIILNQAQRTHRILRDLMSVARPQPPRYRACRPSELLRLGVEGVREECEALGIRLHADVEAADAPAWADPEILTQLADSLLKNAIQATPPGGEIAVRARLKEGELRLTVADTGRGISGQDAQHLLDPFYCGRQAGRGLGLGLARAARSLELIGGALTWTSSPGQGSTFAVRLPLRNVPDEPAERARSERVA